MSVLRTLRSGARSLRRVSTVMKRLRLSKLPRSLKISLLPLIRIMLILLRRMLLLLRNSLKALSLEITVRRTTSMLVARKLSHSMRV